VITLSPALSFFSRTEIPGPGQLSQPSFGQVTLDAAAMAIGNLMLGERRQKASCGPTYLPECSAS
jgi:hypothetical protein